MKVRSWWLVGLWVCIHSCQNEWLVKTADKVVRPHSLHLGWLIGQDSRQGCGSAFISSGVVNWSRQQTRMWIRIHYIWGDWLVKTADKDVGLHSLHLGWLIGQDSRQGCGSTFITSEVIDWSRWQTRMWVHIHYIWGDRLVKTADKVVGPHSLQQGLLTGPYVKQGCGSTFAAAGVVYWSNGRQGCGSAFITSGVIDWSRQQIRLWVCIHYIWCDWLVRTADKDVDPHLLHLRWLIGQDGRKGCGSAFITSGVIDWSRQQIRLWVRIHYIWGDWLVKTADKVVGPHSLQKGLLTGPYVKQGYGSAFAEAGVVYWSNGRQGCGSSFAAAGVVYRSNGRQGCGSTFAAAGVVYWSKGRQGCEPTFIITGVIHWSWYQTRVDERFD